MSTTVILLVIGVLVVIALIVERRRYRPGAVDDAGGMKSSRAQWQQGQSRSVGFEYQEWRGDPNETDEILVVRASDSATWHIPRSGPKPGERGFCPDALGPPDGSYPAPSDRH